MHVVSSSHFIHPRRETIQEKYEFAVRLQDFQRWCLNHLCSPRTDGSIGLFPLLALPIIGANTQVDDRHFALISEPLSTHRMCVCVKSHKYAMTE